MNYVVPDSKSPTRNFLNALPTNPQNAGGLHDYANHVSNIMLPAPKKKNITLNDGYVRLFGGPASEEMIHNTAGPNDVETHIGKRITNKPAQALMNPGLWN